jgi:imidazolonepropionase-like amidohydrolase
VLRGARLIDGIGAAPVDDAIIVITDGRIAAVGPSNATPVPDGATVIDYSGKTIMPGLISNHSHLGVVDGTNVSAANYNEANILRQLAQYESYGVTTVTSLGLNGPLFYELRAKLHSGALPGADIFGADRGIGVPNGAPPAKMLPVGDNQLYRPRTPEEARQAVREMAERKTDLVKLWLDNFGGLLPVKMKPEIYSAVIEEAHAQGLRVAAHVHDLDDAKAVVKAGADILAHGVRDKEVDAELIELLKPRSVWYVPTLALDEATYIYAENPSLVRESYVARGLQPALAAQLNDAAWREKTRAEPKSVKARADVAMNQRNLKIVHDAGVPIGFGTDSGATPLRIAGVAEHRELALMVQAGFTPMQAITTATRDAAKLLKLDVRGVIAPGRIADLVVLDGDPTVDIANTTRIHAVWHRGKQTNVAR